MTEEAS